MTKRFIDWTIKVTILSLEITMGQKNIFRLKGILPDTSTSIRRTVNEKVKLKV